MSSRSSFYCDIFAASILQVYISYPGLIFSTNTPSVKCDTGSCSGLFFLMELYEKCETLRYGVECKVQHSEVQPSRVLCRYGSCSGEPF